MDDRLLVTAAVGRTHGYEGFVHIHPYSGETEHLRRLEECTIVCRDGRSVRVRVLDTRDHSDSFLMRFSGYESKEKASMLSGGKMYTSSDCRSSVMAGRSEPWSPYATAPRPTI